MKFFPAVAYHLCLNLPATFSQPRTSHKGVPCTFAQKTICTPNLQCLYARCGNRKNQPPLPPLYFLMITFWGLSVWRLLARPCNSGRAWRRLSTMAAYQPSYLPSVISLSSLRGCGRRLSLFARRRRCGNHAHETQIARSLARSLVQSAPFGTALLTTPSTHRRRRRRLHLFLFPSL